MRLRNYFVLAGLILLFALIFYSVMESPWPEEKELYEEQAPDGGNATNGDVEVTDRDLTPDVADTMFDKYGLALVGISLLLGAAMLGGIFIAKIERVEEDVLGGERLGLDKVSKTRRKFPAGLAPVVEEAEYLGPDDKEGSP